MPQDQPVAQIRTESALLSDVGRHRKHNEDAVLARGDLGLFLVADGMGGHNAGDVASKLASTAITNFFEATTDAEFTGAPPAGYDHLEPPAIRLLSAIKKANRDVFTISSTVQSHQGMGSTIVAAYVLPDGMIHIAHVGDSRAYRLSEGELEQLTHDHSFINDVLRMKPDIDADHLAKLPKNVITRALGMREDVDVDVRSEPTVAGDIYLLCSDGLCGVVSAEQILEILIINKDPAEACKKLIDLANSTGGRDNISAVIVRIRSDEDTGDDTLQQENTLRQRSSVTQQDLLPYEPPSRERPAPIELAGLDFEEITPARQQKAPVEPAEEAGEEGEEEEGLMVRGLCPECGTGLIEGNQFCVECGSRVAPGDED